MRVLGRGKHSVPYSAHHGIYCGKSYFKPGLFTVHFFRSVHMVTVSENHGFKWFAVDMVFTLSRLKMDGSVENRFAAVRFTVPGQVCGLVTVWFTIPG